MQNYPQNQKEDQRVRVTKKMLNTAFLQLLAQKPVQAISVKELCATAGVNRSTFYLHYRDIYDLLEQIQDEMLQELNTLLDKNPVIGADAPPEEAGKFAAAIFAFVEKNREMCAILLGPGGDKQFVAKIIERGKEKSVEEYMALYPGIGQQQAEMYYSFLAWGFIGLLQYALQEESLPLSTVAASAQRILSQSAHFFG